MFYCIASCPDWEKKDFSRKLLAQAIAQIFPGTSLQFNKNALGAPLPLPSPHGLIYWGVSYTQDLVGIVFGKSEVALDIEQVRPRNTSAYGIHSLREYSLFGGKNWKNFYRIWTRKEALVKLFGIGLDGLDQIKFFTQDEALFDSTTCSLYELSHEDSLICIASKNNNLKVKCLEFEIFQKHIQ